MNLADLLMTTRQTAGLTQEQLAQLVGTTQRSISLLENDKVLPEVRTLSYFCQALNIPSEAAASAYALSVKRRLETP
mgnify:CR=1 FL=1